jgi:hypothetical protein
LSTRNNEIFAHGDPSGAAAIREAHASGRVRDTMLDDFGIEIPAETVPLPSQGITYPVGHPFHGQGTVDITAMTAREEDILTSQALIKKGTVITELIRSCLVNKAARPEHLLSGDRNAIMVAIRITGYGREYEAGITCEACGQNSDSSFDLASLPIKNLTIEPIAPGQNCFEFKLPRTGAVVNFKFLTGADEEQILSEHERKKKKLKVKTDSLVTAKLEKAILSVNGIEDRGKIANFVRRMPAADSRALRNYMDEHEPGIEMQAWTTCEHCGEDQLASMPIGAKFFWPDA